MNNNAEILKKINTEEFIWVVYLVIIGLSFYSNHQERKYYIEKDPKAKSKYRNLNIIIFTIALLVYLYFFIDGYKDVNNLKPWDSDSKRFFNEASFFATTLILIAGATLLFIAIFDVDLETELAFS